MSVDTPDRVETAKRYGGRSESKRSANESHESREEEGEAMINWDHVHNLLKREQTGLLSDNEKSDLADARESDAPRYDALAGAVAKEFSLKRAEDATYE